MPELVLYGIRELAEHHYDPLDQLEPSLDIPRPMRVENIVMTYLRTSVV